MEHTVNFSALRERIKKICLTRRHSGHDEKITDKVRFNSFNSVLKIFINLIYNRVKGKYMKKILFLLLATTFINGVFAQDDNSIDLSTEDIKPLTLIRNHKAEISSGWNKRVTYTVTSPNILTVKGEQNDIDETVIARVKRNEATELLIKVNSISGDFKFGGDVFGIKINGEYIEPEGIISEIKSKINELINRKDINVNQILRFPLVNVGEDIVITLRIYTSCNLELEFWLK